MTSDTVSVDAPRRAGSDRSRSREYDPRKDPKIIGIAVIVFGTLALALAGVGSTPMAAGEDGGAVFPLEDWRDEGPEEVTLSLEANRTSLRPGGTVAFTVTYENGTPARAASIRAGGEEYALDDRGRAAVTFASGGQYTVTADRPNTESTRYVADGEIIAVERYEIPLSVTANATSVTAGEPVAFTVRRADTDEPVSARVAVVGDTHRTDDDGVATVTVDRAGTFEATASKQPTATLEFTGDAVTVSAARRRVPLAVATNRSTVHPGDRVRLSTFRTDTGESVDAQVTIAGERRQAVDGELTVEYDRAGDYPVEATLPDTDRVTFGPAEETLTVERIAAPVSLSANHTTVEPGEAVRFTATRGDTGDPLPGQLTAGNETVWLDRAGVATATFDDPGTVRVSARRANTTTHRFPADALNVTVRDTSYRIADFDAPDRLERGANATVTAAVENVGSDTGTATVVYLFDGERVQSRSLVLGAGQTRPVSFDLPTDVDPGRYDHGVRVRDDQTDAAVEIEPSTRNE